MIEQGAVDVMREIQKERIHQRSAWSDSLLTSNRLLVALYLPYLWTCSGKLADVRSLGAVKPGKDPVRCFWCLSDRQHILDVSTNDSLETLQSTKRNMTMLQSYFIIHQRCWRIGIAARRKLLWVVKH